MQKTVVFVGPTLSRERVQDILPQAQILPPVAAGDLLQLDVSSGDHVAIIDGYYFQAAAVRHKEVLALLARGIQIWGAASMGALRAAELAPFGMRGVGKIFTAYTQREIEGDDEVAILHGPEDMDYPVFTAALVDIREECRCALANALLTEQEATLILTVAASLPFQKRSYAHLNQLVLSKGLAENVAQQFFAFVRRSHATLKQQDALELLHHLQAAPKQTFVPAFAFQKTTFVSSWIMHEQCHLSGKEGLFSDAELLVFYQLFGQDYVAFHYHTLLTAILASLESQSDAVAMPGLEHEYQAVPDDQLEQHIATYLSATCHFLDNQPLPACVKDWLSPAEDNLSRSQKLAKVAIRASYVPRGFEQKRLLFASLQGNPLVHSLMQTLRLVEVFNKHLLSAHPGFLFEQLSAWNVSTWFCQRWNVAESDLTLAFLDRGFADKASFLEHARQFYLFDKYKGIPAFRCDAFEKSNGKVDPTEPSIERNER